MSIFRPEDDAAGISRKSREHASSPPRRSKPTRRQSLVERLENRCLLTVYNPQPATPLTPGPVEGSPLAANLILASFDSFDPIGALSATAAFNGGSPIAATVVQAPGPGMEFVPAVGTVPQYFVELPAGSYTPSQAGPGALTYLVAIQDSNDGSSGAVAGGADVQDAPLTLNSTNPNVPATAGTPLVNEPLAVFTDPSPGATPSSFTALIDWGDGSPQSAATIVPLGGGQFLVRGSHTYATPMTTTISIRVDDLGGSSIVGQTGTVTVADPPIDTAVTTSVSGKQGQLLNNVPLLTFVSHNPLAFPAMFTAQIQWGDGGSSLGTVTRVGSGLFNSVFLVSGSHTYNTTSGSPFPITLNVSDLFGGALPPQTTTATITQSPLTVSVLSFNADVATVAGAGDNLAIVTDLSGSHPASGYSATINWGDGSPDSTVDGSSFLQDIGGTFDVPSPGHTYATSGLFPITVTVNNGEEAVGSGGGFAFVNAQGGASLTPSPVGPIASMEGKPIAAGSTVGRFVIGSAGVTANGLTAVIDWGDGSPNALGTIVAGGSTPTSTTFNVTGNHVYARTGAYTITTTFTDAAHTSATTTTRANVADAPLGSGEGVPVVSGGSPSLVNVPVATFADPNPLARASDFTAVIHWGDGASSTGSVTAIGASNGGGVLFSISGTHAYAASSTAGARFTITTAVAEAANPANALTIPTTATIPSTVTPVAPSTLAVSALPLIAYARFPASLPAGTIVATFTDSSGPHAPSRYGATVTWGDAGPPSNATIVPLGGGSFAVLAGHTYARKGVYELKVAVQHVDPITQATTTGLGANLALVKPHCKAPRLPRRQALHGRTRHPS